MANPLQPGIGLLAKIASLLVHLDEGNSKNGHPFDWTAAKTLWEDGEVQEWLRGMQQASLAPLKR